MTVSCMIVDFEKQMVLRANLLRSVQFFEYWFACEIRDCERQFNERTDTIYNFLMHRTEVFIFLA